MTAPRPSPLVFVHGAQQDGFCWAGLCRSLTRPDRPAWAPDLPGHGRNPVPPIDTVEAMATWLLSWLEQQHIDRACLVGHSLGSLIALEAAAQAPERVEKLALLGAAVPMPVAARLLDTAATNPPRAMATVNRGSHSIRGWLAAPSPVGLWAPGMNLRLMERQPAQGLHRDLSACNAYRNGLIAASRVRCPVLVVSGSEDKMTPLAASRELIGTLADVRQIVIPSAGHALMTEAPEALTAALRSFFG